MTYEEFCHYPDLGSDMHVSNIEFLCSFLRRNFVQKSMVTLQSWLLSLLLILLNQAVSNAGYLHAKHAWYSLVRFSRAHSVTWHLYSRTSLFRTRLIQSPRHFEGRSNALGFTLPLYAFPVISKPRYFELFFHFPWDFEIAGFDCIFKCKSLIG